nr:hypothetical protein [Tanacetum cinerariifolium]
APRVTSPAADEGNMQHNISELTALCTSLQRQYSELQAKFQAQEEEIYKLKERVKVLEDKEDVAVTQSGEDAPIKGTRGIDVPTGSGFIPTAGPHATVISTGSEVGPTASPIATRRKGKEVMVESDTPKKKKLQEQIDAQEETERLKRKGLNLEQEQVKKQKSSEEAPEIETSTEDVIEEKIKEMMQLVPVEDVYVQALQSSGLPTVADEPASLVRDVSEGEACPTDSGFIADQDRATIAKSSTLPHDSAPRAQEEKIVKLKERVKVLEDKEDVAVTQSGDDAPIKGRSINEGEAAAERISSDSEEIARVLTSMDAATVLAGRINVPTGSGFIPTAGPPATIISTDSEVGPTASLIVTRRKGKKVMVESDTPNNKKLQEQIDAQVARELKEQQEKENMRMNKQIAREAEVARIHAKEELQGMIDNIDKSNETIAKYLQEYQDFASELPLEKRIELISDLVKYQDNYSKVEDFIPMGSKEETKRLKRKVLNLEQEQVKKQKSSEEAPEIETSTEDVTEEK